MPKRRLTKPSQLPTEVTIAPASCQAVSAGSFLPFLTSLTPLHCFCKLAASRRTLPRMALHGRVHLNLLLVASQLLPGLNSSPALHQHPPHLQLYHGPPWCDHHITVTFCPPRCVHVLAPKHRQRLMKITAVTWTAMRHHCGRSHWPPRQRARRRADAWRTVAA